MFTDLEKTLTRNEIRKCMSYSNPKEDSDGAVAHRLLRNAYVEYIDTWNIYKAYPTEENKKIMQEKKAKVKEVATKYKDDFEEDGTLLAMKAAYVDVDSR